MFSLIQELDTSEFKSYDSFELKSNERIIIVKPKYLLGAHIPEEYTLEYIEKLKPKSSLDNNDEDESFIKSKIILIDEKTELLRTELVYIKNWKIKDSHTINFDTWEKFKNNNKSYQ